MPEYQEKMLADAGGVTVKHLYITRVDKMQMLVPDLSVQKTWLEFVEQSDKSK
jgi:type I restriction enzyme S subunit